MKSPHLLSSVHDLAICTRSAQTLHKKISSRLRINTVLGHLGETLAHNSSRSREHTPILDRSRQCLTLTTTAMSLARWSYIRHGDETDRHRQCIHPQAFPSILLELSSEVLPMISPSQVLFFAQETPYDITSRAHSRTRLPDLFSGDTFYSKIALQPSVPAAVTGA